jgi:hypothetical protein
MKRHFYYGAVSLLAVCLSMEAKTQISEGGIPLSFSHGISDDGLSCSILPVPDLETLAAEDQENPVPYRFAITVPVDFGIDSSGKWTDVHTGERIWRLAIHAPGTLGLTLCFDRFRLPEGGKMFVYNPTRTRLMGAFTANNNKPSGLFAVALMPGEKLIVEYDPPQGDGTLPVLHINEIAWAYRGVFQAEAFTDDFGQSGPCEVNIRCQEGAGWQIQKRGVARIHIKRQSSYMWCSGALVNNVRNDGTPYFLTADHCGKYSSSQDLEQWIFYFNYESPSCPDPIIEPSSNTITGALLRAHGGDGGNTGSDFFLVEFEEPIPSSYHVYFNGWDRAENASTHGTGIHHPEGDIQKISTYTTPLQSSSWMGHSYQSHWKVVWTETQNGHGVTEKGSSGSPIFNSEGRIVGTLTGGDSSCDPGSLDKPDYYGKFSWHWDKNGADATTRLKDWLDPDHTGVTAIGGWALGMVPTAIYKNITVIPNPFRDQIRIGNLPLHGTTNIQLTDMTGSLLSERDYHIHDGQFINISLPDLVPGMYMLRIQNEREIFVTKVIKQ